MRALILGFSLLLMLPAALVAQDSIDDLFDDAEAGIVEEDPTEEALTTDDLVDTGGPQFSGRVTAEAGAGFGLVDWRFPSDPENDLSLTPFYAMSSRLSIDARPTAETRAYMSFSTSVPSGSSIAFDMFSIDELFLDYTLADTVFFRVGKQSGSWGQGQFFNPANLIAGLSSSISIRASFPLGPISTTLYAIARDSYFSDPALPGIAEVGTAGQMTAVAGPVTLGLQAFRQAQAGVSVSGFAKWATFGVDTAVEGVVRWEPDFSTSTYDVLLTNLWEGGDLGWVITGEWQVDSDSIDNGLGSTVALAVAARDMLPDGWNPAVQWRHTFVDSSGEVVLGLDGLLFNDIDVGLAVPIVYGADGSRFRGSATDPDNRVLSLLLRLTLAVSF